MGRRRSVARELGAEAVGIFAARARPVVPALRRRSVHGGGEAAAAATGKPPRRADAGHIQGSWRDLPDAGSPLLAFVETAGRLKPWPGAEQRHGRHRALEPGPRRRASEELRRGRRRHLARTHQDAGAARHRRRRLRAGLRIFHGLVRPAGNAEGRRVLHAVLHRAAHRRDHRALSRPHPRPRLRLGRHVRPFGGFRAGAQARAAKRSSRSSASRRCPRRSGSRA